MAKKIMVHHYNGYPKSIKTATEIYILLDRYLWYFDIRSDKIKLQNIVLFLKQLLGTRGIWTAKNLEGFTQNVITNWQE